MAANQRARTAILVITVAGGVAGGLLGSVPWRLDDALVALLVLVGTGVGAAAALGLLTTDVAQRPEAGTPEWKWAPGVQQPAPPVPAAPNHVAALPLQPAGGARKWWNEAAPQATTNRQGPATPAPPLSSYTASRALIAQCPRCGDFRLDVNRAGQGYGFRCHNCENTWAWAPGTPWPAVVVRRNLTRK